MEAQAEFGLRTVLCRPAYEEASYCGCCATACASRRWASARAA